MNAGFVHLHVHSTFSFMDGAASLDALIDRAAAFEMPALALTDHQGLSGAIRFYERCKKAGIKPIVGAEIVVETAGIAGDEDVLPPERRLVLPASVGFGRAAGSGFHLTLLARNLVGYRNLCRLLSKTHLRGPAQPSIVRLFDLAEHAEGLIGLSGCPNGEAAKALLAGAPGRAREVLRRLASCFEPGDFYVELTHQLTPDAPRLVSGLAGLADDLALPIVATNNVHYLRSDDFRLHDVLASAGARMALPGPYDRPNAELWFKPAAEMRRLFEAYPRACDATLEIAARCDLDLGLGEFHFPAANIPRGETPYSVLAKEAWRGLERRYRPMVPDALKRLQHELALIEQMGFSEYFLVVKEIVDFARSQGIRYSGRGSAGDSIVSYALNITDADPVAYDLLFERFLNPARRQMPDIDVDFDSARRDEVIDFIYKRFGSEHVAMVATVNTMTARSAVRTVARAFGLPIDDVNRLSRHLPWVSSHKLREVLETYPECTHHPLRDEGRWGMLIDLAEQFHATPMHLGTHLGGFIITREPVASWTPLQWAAKGVVVSQYDKDDVEALGLVKMDILGLRMHSAISGAVELARERVGEEAVPEPFELPSRRPRRLRDDRARRHGGDVPARVERAAEPEHAPAGERVRGHRRGDLALSPRTPRSRDDYALHPPPARHRRGERPARRDARRAQRHLRRHHLPGAGAARRKGGRGIRSRRGRFAQACDDQEPLARRDGRHQGALPRAGARRGASSPRSPRRSFGSSKDSLPTASTKRTLPASRS